MNPLLHCRSYWGNFFHVKSLQEAIVSSFNMYLSEVSYLSIHGVSFHLSATYHSGYNEQGFIMTL